MPERRPYIVDLVDKTSRKEISFLSLNPNFTNAALELLAHEMFLSFVEVHKPKEVLISVTNPNTFASANYTYSPGNDSGLIRID